ncbi:hypothetical protein Tco_1121520 [Tanacetum coccineum]|uniref:Uncharacterized protein n=1 Tax=Tanacetum coccineum TaxID=301880 RepID=A0ABQ5IZH0_9ASTR
MINRSSTSVLRSCDQVDKNGHPRIKGTSSSSGLNRSSLVPQLLCISCKKLGSLLIMFEFLFIMPLAEFYRILSVNLQGLGLRHTVIRRVSMFRWLVHVDDTSLADSSNTHLSQLRAAGVKWGREVHKLVIDPDTGVLSHLRVKRTHRKAQAVLILRERERERGL